MKNTWIYIYFISANLIIVAAFQKDRLVCTSSASPQFAMENQSSLGKLDVFHLIAGAMDCGHIVQTIDGIVEMGLSGNHPKEKQRA